jgi:simple sugar transport system permease protein
MKRVSDLLRRSAVPTLSVITALLFGAVVIILTDFDHLSKIGSDPLGAIGGAIGGVVKGYGAMLSGALGDPGRIGTALQTGSSADIAKAIRPITETLVATTPLIFCGLGVAISFRAGMFNIGGDGQLRIGALGATMVAIAWPRSLAGLLCGASLHRGGRFLGIHPGS